MPVIESFHEDFQSICAARAEAVALIEERTERHVSYADLARRCGDLGRWYADQGLRPGDTVLALLPNAVETLVAMLAAMREGLGYAPMAETATAREVEHWTATIRPALALISESIAPEITELLAAKGIATRKIRPGDMAIGDAAIRADGAPPDHPGPARPGRPGGRLYLASSGTTGMPKAMVFDIDRLWSSGRAFARAIGIADPGLRFLNFLPMSYLGGLFNLGLIPLGVGASTVVCDAFSGRTFLSLWNMVERFDVSMLWLVPTILRGVVSLATRAGARDGGPRAAPPRAAAGVRMALLGTAPIDLAAKRGFEAAFGIPVLENFALSETTFLTSEMPAGHAGHRPRSEGSTGGALDYVSLKLRHDPQIEGADAGGGPGIGEILARTPYGFLGYLEDGVLRDPRDGEGFIATGDLGRFDAAGNLCIVGRKRDIVKRGGYLVELREIEVLALEYPGVAEAAAIGVPHDFYGESVVLCVRPGGEAPLTEAGLPAMSAWLRRNLVRHKWPEDIRIVTDLPRTASGKIRKHLVLEGGA